VRVPAAAVTAAVIIIAAVASVATAARAREYESPLRLANTVLARWPSPNAHQMVGTELAKLGRHEEALPHLRQAVSGYAPARYFLGSSLLKLGRLDDGIAELRQFIDEQPHALAARGAHGMIANAFAAQQRFGAAVPHYREYLRAQPGDGEAWNGLGVALAMSGRAGEAVEAFQGATKVSPRRAEFFVNLARALQESGRVSEAQAALERAAALDPSILRR
jgi:tetratricopeptide (TPR) repeat protein